MPNPTFKLIASVEVGSGGASSIDFTSIPATYTDLCLVASVRPSTLDDLYIKFNSSSSSFSAKVLRGNGSSVSSDSSTYWGTPQSATSSTFTSCQFYIPNYASSNNKSFSAETVSENNATTAYMAMSAGLWSNSSAVNGLSLYFSSGTFVQYSTAYLYGISNS